MTTFVRHLPVKKALFAFTAFALLAGTTVARAATVQTPAGRHAAALNFETRALSGASSTPTPTTDADSETYGGGGNNEVKVTNQTDNKLEIKGRVQLNHITSSNAAPQNEAYAYSSCAHCDSFAVALQINLVGTGATNFKPQNSAVALNYMCTGCTTVAKALQYNISEANPNQAAANIKALVKAMQIELKLIESDRSITLSQARTDINGVVDQFQALGHYLSTKRQVDTSTTNPKAKPLPGAKPTATPSASPTTTPTPTS